MANYKYYFAKSLSAGPASRLEDYFHLRILMKDEGNDQLPYWSNEDDNRIQVERLEENEKIKYKVSVWLNETVTVKPLIYKDWIFSEKKSDFDRITGKIVVHKTKQNGEEEKETHDDLVYQTMPAEYPVDQ